MTPDQATFAGDLLRSLELVGQIVPQNLMDLAMRVLRNFGANSFDINFVF